MTPELAFPFWVVTQRYNPVSVPVTLPGTPGCLAVFTTAEKATKYMIGLGQTAFEFRLVSRVSFHSMVTEFYPFGVMTACLDPTPGACSGAIDLLRTAARLTQYAEDDTEDDG